MGWPEALVYSVLIVVGIPSLCLFYAVMFGAKVQFGGSKRGPAGPPGPPGPAGVMGPMGNTPPACPCSTQQ